MIRWGEEMRRSILAAALLLASFSAAAEEWPSRPVKMVVPFPPGGGTDVVSRTVANHLAKVLGQPIVIDNRGGAGGTLGSDVVAKAAPDGYTIGMATSSTHPAAVVLRNDVPYDPVKNFAPITMVGTTPYILVIANEVPAKDLREFLAHAKAHPGKLNFASVGTTTLGYLLTEQFRMLAGLDLVHVPYKGASQVYPDLIANRVSVFLDNPTGSAGLVKGGQVRPLAVTERSAVLPEVPTFAEAGVADFTTVFWYGLVAPAGTPQAIVRRIQGEVARYAKGEGVAELGAKDVKPVGDSPESFAATIAADIERWRTLANRIGVKPE
jgi:tripartite-type tricarboxylate transporter receptor subunit TctC